MCLVMTSNISDNDPRRFSTATPKLGTSAYLRIYDPVSGKAPLPCRIVQDMHKVVNALKVINKAKGVYVPGLAGGRISGGRNEKRKAGEKTSNNHGGKGTKLAYNDALNKETMHSDLRDLLDETGGYMDSYFIDDESENDFIEE